MAKSFQKSDVSLGERKKDVFSVNFNKKLRLEFCGSQITSKVKKR